MRRECRRVHPAVSYLDVEAELGGTFLHPGGRDLTRHLLGLLEAEPSPRRVLDVGCGTASTAALAARSPDTIVVGLERSDRMLAAARQRVSAAGAGRHVALIQADGRHALPFTAASFDVAFAESVVVLLDVRWILLEMSRVLRPGGLVILNERIWKDGVTPEQVAEVNAVSARAFGFRAATPEPWDCEDWQRLLRDTGFSRISTLRVDDLLEQCSPAWHLSQRLERLQRYLTRPALLARSLHFKVHARRQADLWSYLECFLFVARKAATADRAGTWAGSASRRAAPGHEGAGNRPSARSGAGT